MEPDGAAGRAGLKGPKISKRGVFVVQDVSTADVIIAVDAEKVATPAEFLGFIESKKPGESVTITVLRDERPVEITVELGGEEKPKSSRASSADSRAGARGRSGARTPIDTGR